MTKRFEKLLDKRLEIKDDIVKFEDMIELLNKTKTLSVTAYGATLEFLQKTHRELKIDLLYIEMELRKEKQAMATK